MDMQISLQLIVFVSLGGFTDCEITPFFNVTGMSSELPDICLVDYNGAVNINIEVTNVGCGADTRSGAIQSVEWTAYKIGTSNNYTINTSDPFITETGTSSYVTWNNLNSPSMRMFAVQAMVSLVDFHEEFRIMGYLVIGCHDLAENSKNKCGIAKEAVRDLAGNSKQIWDLRLCNDTVAIYEAKSSVEFSIQPKEGRPTYNEPDLYNAGVHLENRNTVSFQIKGRRHAYILLMEDREKRDTNVVEVEIAAYDDTKSVIRSQLAENASLEASHLESNLLHAEVFRTFWISFAGTELRVGKGEIPYAQQFLKWSNLQHAINYMAVDNGYSEGGVWKFSIDVCMQPPFEESSREVFNKCKETRWFYNRDSTSCEEWQADCQQASTTNCFQSAASCNKACGNLIPGEPYGKPCTNSSQCSTREAVCIGEPTVCSCNSESYFNMGSNSCLPKKPFGSLCTDVSQCATAGVVCSGGLCTCDSKLHFHDNETDSCVPLFSYGEACMTARQCATRGSACAGDPHKCSCGSNTNYYDISDACLEDLQLEIRCIKNCLLYKIPDESLEYKVEAVNEQLQQANKYTWMYKECETIEGDPCTSEKEISTDSNMTFSKPNDANIYEFVVYVEAVDGRRSNTNVRIQFSPVPEKGACTVNPVIGYVLLTDFTVTCENFTVEGNFSITYTMKSNTVNDWSNGRQFYSGPNSTVTGVKLQQGKESDSYKLYIMVEASLIESGASSSDTLIIQVKETSGTSAEEVFDAVRGLIEVKDSHQNSTIDQMIGAGDQIEALNLLTTIASSLNQQKNDSDDENMEKSQLYDTVVTSIDKVNFSSYDVLYGATETLKEVAKGSTILSENTQDNMANILDNLVSELNTSAPNNDAQVESSQNILSSISNLVSIRATRGKEDLTFNETTEDDDSIHKAEKYKAATEKLLDTVNKMGNLLLEQNQTEVLIQADEMSLQVLTMPKQSHNTIQQFNQFEATVTINDSDVSNFAVQGIHMSTNPYIWDRTAKDVNRDVLSVSLKNSDKTEINAVKLDSPLRISIPSDFSLGAESKLILHVKQDQERHYTYDLSEANMLVSSFVVEEGKATTLSIDSLIVFQTYKVLISDYLPTFNEVINFGATYPDDIPLLTRNLSNFNLSSEIDTSSNLTFITYNSENLNAKNGEIKYYVAITVDLELNSTIDHFESLNLDCFNTSDANCIIEIPLNIETRSLKCTFWDEESQAWSNEGCEVSPFSTRSQLECLCTHMTAFSGGVFVVPNLIDPLDTALFLTFFDNPVVVTTVVIVWMLYFFLIHWARKADRKDQERVGVIAVGDMNPNNTYSYLVCVVTGWWAEAGTTANVFFYMEGSRGSSQRIKLTTSARLCFQTGYEDWFLVTTEKSLGELQDVTLWHDNTGTSPHWYLSQVFVKDLQTKRSWTFIYNEWLAVDRGRVVQTTASLSAVTKDQLKLNQKHNFLVKTTQDLRDSHLWISIFSKPVRSPFTRVQRLTCALSLLLTTMLTNIMFYGIPTDDPDDQVGGARGIVISLSSIVIGIQSSLIMFPVNVIIMQMFLKIKQKPVKQTNTEHLSYIQSLFDKVSTITTNVLRDLVAKEPLAGEEISLPTESSSMQDDTCDGCQNNVEGSSFNSIGTASSLTSACDDPGHSIQVTFSCSSMSRSGNIEASNVYGVNSSKSDSSSIVVLSESKETGKFLPWWFLYIAWTLVLIVSLVSSYFVMLYGLKYGYQKSVEWLVSFLTGFSQSALITQPLKVLAVAVIITLIFKRAVEFDDYGPEVRLDEDAAFLNSVNQTDETHIPYSEPMSSSLLKKIRKRLQLEWLMDMTIRDICLYVVYLVIVCIVVHGHRDIKEAYLNSVAIEDVLVNPGCINPNHCFFLEKVDNVPTFYQYIHDSAIPSLSDMMIADHEYATPGSSHFLVGPWRIRQVRVEKDSCSSEADVLAKQFDMNLPGCTGPYWIGDEDQRHFNQTWAQPVSEPDDPPNMWTYQSAWKLKTIPFAGKLATYSGGGYIQTMPSTLQAEAVGTIEQSDWIDERTRAVFLEFTLYNPNADLFSVVIILFEFSNNGAVFPYHQIFSTSLYHYSTDFAIFVAVCEALFLAFNIGLTYVEWKKFSMLGRKKYFEDYWNCLEIIQILLSFSVVGLFFQRIVSVSSVMSDFRQSDGTSFISFYTAISWDFILNYVMAFLVALITLKAVKLLKFNKRTYMVADTIAYSKSSILSFLCLAVIVAIAFGHFATMAFGKVMKDYREMIRSLITIFNFSMGVSDLYTLQETNRILGPAYFVSFVFVVTFVFLTVFMAILNFGINDSKAMFEKRQNKFELLDYLTKKVKKALKVEKV